MHNIRVADVQTRLLIQSNINIMPILTNVVNTKQPKLLREFFTCQIWSIA